MSLHLLIPDEAALTKQFLLTAKLRRPVVLTPLAGLALSFDIRGLAAPAPHDDASDMLARAFSGPTGPADPLTLGTRPGTLSLLIGRLTDSAHPDAVHVLLSSGRTGLGERFGQIELTRCLADDRAVYLTKILSKDGGEGAIVRLRSGTMRPEEREYRRLRLAEAMGADRILEFAGETHLVVASFALRELRKRSSAAMARFVSEFLRYAALVELIRGDKDLIVDKTKSRLRPSSVGGGYAPRQTAQDRIRIENAAMEEARRWLEERHYVIEDTSDRRLGYDLSAYNLTGKLKVAVKGTTLEDWSIELKPSEYNCATNYRGDYVLLVVQLEDLSTLRPVKVIPIANPVSDSGYTIVGTRYALRPKR